MRRQTYDGGPVVAFPQGGGGASVLPGYVTGMSFPGDQSNQPHRPHQPQPPRPSPDNPYAQPTGPYVPSQTPQGPQGPPPGPFGSSSPQQAYPGAAGPGVAPGAPMGQASGQPPGAGSRRVPAWAWALGGAVVASAVWAGTLLMTGGFGGADLAGYSFHDHVCDRFDRSAVKKRYPSEDGEPTEYSSNASALASGYCSIALKDPESSSEYARTYVTFNATWHKKSDPEPEFAARVRSYEDRDDDKSEYDVKKAEGIGDEAYFTTDRSAKGKPVRWAQLVVRDGWFESSVDWSGYSSASESDNPLSEAEIRKMLTTDMKATLAALKKP